MLIFLRFNRLLIFGITYPNSLALRGLTWKFHCLCVSRSQPQMNVNVTVLQQGNVVCLNIQLTLQCLNIWYTATQFYAQNSKYQVKVWAFNGLPYADLNSSLLTLLLSTEFWRQRVNMVMCVLSLHKNKFIMGSRNNYLSLTPCQCYNIIER